MAEYVTIRLSLVNLFGIPSKTMEVNYPTITPLIQILQKFLEDIGQAGQLGAIAVLNQNNQILDLDWVNLPLNIVVENFGNVFTIVDRASVNGPDLSKPYPAPQAAPEESIASMDFGADYSSFRAEPVNIEKEEEILKMEKEESFDEFMPAPKAPEVPSKPTLKANLEGPSLRMMMEEQKPSAPPSPPRGSPPSPPGAPPSPSRVATSPAGGGASGLIAPDFPAEPRPPQPSPTPSAQAPPPPAAFELAEAKEKKWDESKKAKKGKMEIASKSARKRESQPKMALADEMEFEEEEILMEDITPAYAPPEPEVQSFEKNISLEYFDKMNPEKYYPLVVDVANIEQAYIAPEENLFTGERKIQTKEKTEFKLKTSIVMVRPVFPGCVISPPELRTDFKDEKDRLTFYVTPLVKDGVEGRIDFVNEGVIVHSLAAPASVDDPRYAKTIAAYGTMASVLPRIFPFFGLDFGQEMTIDETIPMLTGVFGGMVLANVIAILGVIIAFVVGGFVYYSKKPNSVKRKFTIGDLRMKKTA